MCSARSVPLLNWTLLHEVARVPVLNLLNPVHTVSYYLFDICLNNILPSKVRFLECSLSFRCCHYNSVCTSSCLPCVPLLPPISTFSDIIPLIIFALAYKSCISLLCNCLSPPCYFLPLTYAYFHRPVLEHTPCGRPGFASKRYQSNYVFFYITFLDCTFFFLNSHSSGIQISQHEFVYPEGPLPCYE
jgi:hypothetical protein